MKRAALRVTNYFIDIDSKNYIGVLCKWLWIINELQKFSGIPSDNIKLKCENKKKFVKKKKKDTFRRLGDQLDYLQQERVEYLIIIF